MLIILLEIFFGLMMLATLVLAITILISIISDHRHGEEFIRQAGYHGRSFKVKGNYTSRSYQFE